MNEGLKHNLNVVTKAGSTIECHYVANYAVGGFVPYGHMMTRIMTIDGQKIDMKLMDIQMFVYITSPSDAIDARDENAEADGFTFDTDEDEVDLDEILKYDSTDGNDLEGYM